VAVLSKGHTTLMLTSISNTVVWKHIRNWKELMKPGILLTP